MKDPYTVVENNTDDTIGLVRSWVGEEVSNGVSNEFVDPSEYMPPDIQKEKIILGVKNIHNIKRQTMIKPQVKRKVKMGRH
jgi:hypothetical protein